MSFFTSKLEKLTIKSHKDAARLNEDQKFEAMFNPESYSLHYQNVYDHKQGINTTGRKARYSMSKPEKLNIKLILDGTRVNEYQNPISIRLRGAKEHDVNKRVQDFLEMTSYMDGKIHEPNTSP